MDDNISISEILERDHVRYNIQPNKCSKCGKTPKVETRSAPTFFNMTTEVVCPKCKQKSSGELKRNAVENWNKNNPL